jgi:Tfp pilus assembly protein PilF
MGKYDPAIEYCRCAQQLLQRRFAEFSMTHGRTLGLLGAIYSELEDLELSMYYLQRATAIYRTALPQDHYEFGFHLNRIAYVYWQNKQYQAALNLLADALPLVEKKLPTYYFGHAQTLYIMGLVQHSLNNREQAFHYFKQSLEMRESGQATDHPSVARTCYELSKLYEEQDDYSVALDYAQRSLCIRKAKLPPSHKELKQSIELVRHLSLQINAT